MSPPLLLPTLFLLFLTASAQDSDPDPDCTGRWIHIRQLPPQFNLDLLSNCSEYPVSGDFCPFVGNHGLGQKTHNFSRSWYRTDPLMLELIFYAGLDALRYLYGPDQNSSSLHGLDLFHFLTHTDNPSIWNRHRGHDHFLIMARPAWHNAIFPVSSYLITFLPSYLNPPHLSLSLSLSLSHQWMV